MMNRALAWVLLISLSSCATAPWGKRGSPRELLGSVCAIGSETQAVQGTATLRARSDDASGTFPATVVAKRDSLLIEANNLLGGVEAVIRITAGHYEVQIPEHPEKASSGGGSWGGIPLYWANHLFLGRVPCPMAGELGGAALSADGDTLRARVRSSGTEDQYVYELSTAAAQPWPKSLHWERHQGGRTTSVDFQFEDPEEATRSPLRWEARSSHGQVKVQWKERQVSR